MFLKLFLQHLILLCIATDMLLIANITYMAKPETVIELTG